MSTMSRYNPSVFSEHKQKQDDYTSVQNTPEGTV